MASACVTLLTDPALWQARAQAGLEEARRYTWESVQPALLAVYMRALQRASG